MTEEERGWGALLGTVLSSTQLPTFSPHQYQLGGSHLGASHLQLVDPHLESSRLLCSWQGAGTPGGSRAPCGERGAHAAAQARSLDGSPTWSSWQLDWGDLSAAGLGSLEPAFLTISQLQQSHEIDSQQPM